MSHASAPIRHADRFYIGGQWVTPSSDATISVIDSDTEQLYFTRHSGRGAEATFAGFAALADTSRSRSPPSRRPGSLA
jgi:aldehyde dehydrogenase (NAD+)